MNKNYHILDGLNLCSSKFAKYRLSTTKLPKGTILGKLAHASR